LKATISQSYVWPRVILQEIEDIRAGTRIQEIQREETSELLPHQIEVRLQVFEDLESSILTYDRLETLNRHQKRISVALT